MLSSLCALLPIRPLVYCFLCVAISGCSFGRSVEDVTAIERVLLSDLIIDDAALESCIAGTAISSGWLYVDEVTQLHCSGRGITSLEGMQAFQSSSLTALFLLKNDIQDITPLADLVNLEELALGGNRIVNTTPLRNLTRLVMLDLGENQVAEMFPLVGLEVLLLQGNHIEDVAMFYQLSNLSYVNLALNGDIPCWQLRDLEGVLAGAEISHTTCEG